MEHSIGVGLIVGLTFASSVYIWNSKNFSKVQKIILLLFVVFPPLQWIAILIVSIYNTNKSNSTPEKINEKKLDYTIANLTDLKQKGILTEVESKEKLNKIEQEKTEQNLKNSLEYKQLQSLYESGVLIEEEFKGKVLLLKSSIEKENTKIPLTEENLKGSYKTVNNIITFSSNNIFEISNKNGKSTSKWEIINNDTITISKNQISTNFKEFVCKPNKISYIHGNTLFEGIKI